MRSRTIPGTAALVAVVLSLFPLAGAAQLRELRPLPGSMVVLTGRTTVGPWRCSIEGALGVLGPDAVADPVAAVEVRLPLSGVDCPSRGMESDLRNALRSDRHPQILVRSLRVRDATDEVASVLATLEVAGVARDVSAQVRWAIDGQRLRLTGELPLRMSDFGVEPPRAMLGLIRADDRVIVEYDVTVAVPMSSAAESSGALPLALRRPR